MVKGKTGKAAQKKAVFKIKGRRRLLFSKPYLGKLKKNVEEKSEKKEKREKKPKFLKLTGLSDDEKKEVKKQMEIWTEQVKNEKIRKSMKYITEYNDNPWVRKLTEKEYKDAMGGRKNKGAFEMQVKMRNAYVDIAGRKLDNYPGRTNINVPLEPEDYMLINNGVLGKIVKSRFNGLSASKEANIPFKSGVTNLIRAMVTGIYEDNKLHEGGNWKKNINDDMVARYIRNNMKPRYKDKIKYYANRAIAEKKWDSMPTDAAFNALKLSLLNPSIAYMQRKELMEPVTYKLIGDWKRLTGKKSGSDGSESGSKKSGKN
tara:strand:- start:223 stop:1170 length:948 start_codon:yes stop_codon:yes gene_type:complete